MNRMVRDGAGCGNRMGARSMIEQKSRAECLPCFGSIF